MSNRIECYALLSNCRTAALVGLDGSVDWLCLPNFSSPACFAALLGSEENGRWQIAPDGEFTSRRTYRGDTMILETTFIAPDGSSAMVIDFLSHLSDDEPIELVRVVRGVRGQVKLHIDVTFRFDYGKVKPWIQQTGHGIRGTAGPDSVILHTPVRLHALGDHHVADFVVSAGGPDVAFVLTYFPSHHSAPQAGNVTKAEKETEQFWAQWSSHHKTEHRWRDAVMRSLLTIKSLTFEPTGGIVAAPTTSLPESIGSDRNWDYRYCWIRDASISLFALFEGGYGNESLAWRQWILRAAAGDPADLQIMYDIFGKRRLDESELDWLPGYENSRPVRIGNAAYRQFQLDVYGELIAALHVGRKLHSKSDGGVDAWNLQLELMKFLGESWDKPDHGLWEVRGPSRQFTHSKVFAWMAVDRSIKDAESLKLEAPLGEWRSLRDRIHEETCRLGFNEKKNTFTQYFGSTNVDAALLIIARTGFLPPTDTRFVATVQAIERELLVDKTFVNRYQFDPNIDGIKTHESAFLPCAFWLAEAYALIGRRDEAIELFERLLGLRNDVGLISEEYDYRRHRLAGNFPQAFTHVAIIATATLLSGREGWHPTGRLRPAED